MLELPPFLADPPEGWDPEQWAALTDGARLRWVKEHQLELSLSREEYLALARLPFWASYGPEHGLPESLFNTRGFLLPKHLPGGGLYERFRIGRRCYRHISWRERAIRRRLERFDYLHGGIALLCAWFVIFVAAEIGAPVISRFFPRVPEEVLTFGVATLGLVGLLLLVRTGFGLILWCMRRRVLREFPAEHLRRSTGGDD